MPRKPKPYYRKAQKRWVCTIDGERITLGPDREAACEKFYELMLDRSSVQAHITTLYEVSQVYLDWILDNRAKGTYVHRKYYLEQFIKHVGRTLKIADLKKHQMTKWTNRDSWNSTTRNDAIKAVQRMLNWAVDEGYISDNPIARIKKPKRLNREIVYTTSQWAQIKKHANGTLAPFLDFLWMTGCRPKEARILESRHVHDDLIIYPPDESKGEKDARVIFMTTKAKAIVGPLLEMYPSGVLFRNSQGNPWTKDSIKDRLTRIRDKVGFRVIAYGARHSYATNALIKSVDIVSLATLMGHRDTRMIASVYAHLSKNTDFLRAQANKAERPDALQSFKTRPEC
jgi:integrase